jgi:hypothetical protein
MVLFNKGEEFGGLSVLTISSGNLELDVLESAGPRIIRLRSRFLAGVNILAEVPDQRISTPYGDYRILGGHRLQTSPETSPSTYIPDFRPVEIHKLPNGLQIHGQVEPETGLSRSINLQFVEGEETLLLSHILKNHGLIPLQISAWSLTMLPPGGHIIMPLQLSSDTTSKVLPDRSLVFWPYSRLESGGFLLREKTAELAPSADHKPFKLGGLVNWLAYAINDLVFVKSFSVFADRTYPDRGCSAEAYGNGDFVELESLSPLVDLEPGQSLDHSEEWHLLSRADFDAFLVSH